MLVTGWVSSRLGAKRTLLARPGHHHRRRRPRRHAGHDRRHRRLPRRLGPRQRPVHRHRPRHHRQRRAGARSARRSSCTRPRWVSASPPDRCIGGWLGVDLLARPVLRRLRPHGDRPARHRVRAAGHARHGRRTSLAEPLRALRHRGLLLVGAHGAAVQLRLLHAARLHAVPARTSARTRSASSSSAGALLLAFTSVWVAPRLQRRFGTLPGSLGVAGRLRRDPRGHGHRHRQQGGAGRRRRPRRRVPRRQQHPHHRDGHEGRAGRARGGLGGLQLRPVRRRRRRPVAGRQARREAQHPRAVLGRRRRRRLAAVVLARGRSRALRATSTPSRVTARRARTRRREAEAVTVGDA